MAIRNKKSSPLRWFSGHKFASTALFLLILVAGFFVYQRIALEMNKHAFQQARTAIDTIYADIVSKVGKPDNFKRTNDCSRPSEEFGRGPLSCSVGTSLAYGVNNEQEANNLLHQIQSVIKLNDKTFKPSQPLSSSLKDTLVVNSYYHTASDRYNYKQKIKCSSNYVYDTPRETFLSLSQGDEKNVFFISVDCSGGAKDQYYPLD